MACKLTENICSTISREFEEWQENKSNVVVVLVELTEESNQCTVQLLLGCEYDVQLHVPTGYPDSEDSFFVESDSVIQTWTIAINEFLLDSPGKLSLADVLDRAVSLYSTRKKPKLDDEILTSEDEELEDDSDDGDDEDITDDIDNEDEEMLVADEAFTTEWDLVVARKKTKWSRREPVVRELMKKKRMEQGLEARNKSTEQIFTSTAASGILANDLVKIMETEEASGMSAEPIQDNIYHWRVTLSKFEPSSDLQNDLREIKTKHGYDYIEMEMTFEIDLFPFYPPLVKVIRPRLLGCMMQRISNIELLQLSYWSPAKDMRSVIADLHAFLQQWARIDVSYERNDLSRCPYLDIEHHLLTLAQVIKVHLLTLAQVSEVTPRANQMYAMDEAKMKELKSTAFASSGKLKEGKEKKEYWAKGVGFGHNNRPGWDINAYIAAQKEKDNKIESALRDILRELKCLQTNMFPHAGSSTADDSGASTSYAYTNGAQGDFVDDIYSVLEGSALIPCLEKYLQVDSFLEINRHSVVYTVIINVIREIAYRKELLPLLCVLLGQTTSVYELLEHIDRMASVFLQQIHKPANGCVPDHCLQTDIYSDPDSSDDDVATPNPLSKCIKTSFMNLKSSQRNSPPPQAMASTNSGMDLTTSAEGKLAREFIVLFKLVDHGIESNGLQLRCRCKQTKEGADSADAASEESPLYQPSATHYALLEARYKERMKPLLFQSCDIPVEGKFKHHYSSKFDCPRSSSQVLRIVQELSSLSTSLPLDLSSAIFVRTDDEKISLMRALITGPEGTPYSSGCFVFDIHFPPTYPKTPPKVNLQTTGNGSVRFNPNLYNCGTVCLSLLGTWQGQKGEEWNEKTATILQVLISIQSLILVPDPYFNEPGYEQSIGTDHGKKQSDDYNRSVKINNITYAMIAQLQQPTPGFEDVIRTHFYLKKDHILQEVKEWTKNHKCSKLQSAVSSLKKELRKLEPPSSQKENST